MAIKRMAIPDFIIDSMEVKKLSNVRVNDMKNEFITEELVLSPMYESIVIDSSIASYKFFPYNDFRLELYCNKCKCRRIFAFENSPFATISMGMDTSPNDVASKLKRVDYFSFSALADCGHELVMNFKVIDESTIMKIGQFPSIYEMNELINNKSFLKDLDKEYQDYYKKACSSFSFGFCIGAMSYLRRIFEKLLLDTFNLNAAQLKINFDDFKKQRMEDKIKTLKNFLPEIMQDHGFNLLYPKISDGIHNLEESECKKIFIILKSGIEEILLENQEKREKEARKKELSKQLQNI